jgi:hypothetical protein
MIRRLLVLLLALTAFNFATPALAGAADIVNVPGGVNCSEFPADQMPAACKDRTDEDPVPKILRRVTRIIAFITGAAAVLLVIVGGLRYVTANGNAENISSAKRTIIGALIGLVVIVLGQALIVFVIGKL